MPAPDCPRCAALERAIEDACAILHASHVGKPTPGQVTWEAVRKLQEGPALARKVLRAVVPYKGGNGTGKGGPERTD